MVLEEATAADPVAGEIVANHGRILGTQARACADAVGLLGNGRFPVVLTGGVFHNPSAVLSDAILANVPEGDAVALPHAPVIGALLLAFDTAGIHPDLARIVEGAHA